MSEKTNKQNNKSLPNINITRKFIFPYQDLLSKLSYIYNYTKGSFDALLHNSGEYIDLSNKNVERITSNTKNVDNILTNEFLERNNNTIRKAKDFKNSTDTLLGDKQIPLSKISNYYGIENGKLKAGDLNIFNDETVVIPNRVKNVGRIKKLLDSNEYDMSYYDKYINDVDSVAKLYNDSLGYKPTWSNYLTAIVGGLTPRAIYMNNAGFNELSKLFNKVAMENPTKYTDPNYKPKRFITENNDTIAAPDINDTPKILFANEQGNSAFFTNPYNNLDKVNKFLNKNPSYPIMVDNGRYAFYQTTAPNVKSYAGLANPDDMFILGTTNKKELGGKAGKKITKELPEITVYPKDWQYNFNDTFGNMSDIIKQEMNDKMYKKLFDEKGHFKNTFGKDYSTTKALERFYNIYKLADSPTITNKTTILDKINHKIRGDRAYYNPITNKIYAKNLDDIISEFSHVINPDSNFISYITQLPNTIKGEFNIIKQNHNKDKFITNKIYNHYNDPSHYEYSTHKIVEPLLSDYIFNDIPNKYIKEMGGDNKQYKPNIIRGGIAVPLGNNYYFMKGRKHKQGGIDVGKDLEVEDGEVMKLTKDNIKVFSAVPFLNGQSPVEKLLGGEDPNKVFAQQERFKKVNKINDDGTKAQLGKGKKITTTEIPESQQYAVTTPDGQRKVFNSKQEASDYVTANTPKGYSLYDTTNYGTNIDKGQTAILNRNTEREIEKATKQEELAKARLATRQQNQQIGKEMLSYMPVIGDGMDLYQLGKDIYNKQYGNAAITAAALTMPAWADALVKPIGKAVKIGYNKFNNLFRKNNKLNEDDYVKNLNYIYSKYIRNQDLNLISDETWDYLYDKAIKENNLKEVQKLRALHFKQKAVGNKNNQLQYHGIANGYDPNFTIFNPKENHASVFTSNDLNTSTSYVDDFITSNEQKNAINKSINDAEQILLEEIENYHKRKNKGEFVDPNHLAFLETHLKHLYKHPEVYKNRVMNSADYSPERVKRLYTYLENPVQFNNQGKRWNQIKLSYLPEDVVNKIPKDDITRQLYQLKTQHVEDLSRSMGYDGVIIDDMVDFGMSSEYKIIDANKPAQIVITNDPRKLKLADPITYDDNGKIIPLSKRDDFTNPDIRYSWLLPTIGATTGLSLLNNNDQNVKRFGGKVNKFRNGGDVTPEEEALWKANNTVKPASNYHAAKDMYITKTREDFTDFVQRNFPNCPTGLSNCTLTASQFYGNPIGRAHTIVTNPKENNLYPVNEEHAIPGTMVIASDPLGNINPKYHTMILSGYADKDYPFEYNGIKYNIKKGEPLVHYSKRKNNKESYKKNIPLRVYNDQSEGKTYNRYYRPYDKNGLPNVLLPELIVTNKKVMGGNHKLNTNITPIAKSTSKETPIFGLAEQEAFKKSIVGSKSNPDYIRGTFDFRDNKELINKVDPNTIKVDSTNIRYKGAPSNGNYFKNYNAGDYISLGANVLGNIGSALINKHTLDNMEYASAPVPKIAIKQKTNFNINPQLDLSRERLREGVSDINTNTASSSTVLNRNNKLRLANIMNTNQLYGIKENMETQLINADRMNQQNVFNSNIDAFNTWNKEKNIFETAKQEKYGENKVGAVQGISQAVHDFINNNEKRRQFNNSLISIMAANPNVNPELYKVLGADWITDEHIRNWKLANNYKV